MSEDPEARGEIKRDGRARIEESDDDSGGCMEVILKALSMLFILLTFPVTIWFCVRMVQEYQRAVIFRLGRVKKGDAVGPGLFFIIPCIDEIQVVDLRTVSFDVPPQEILTKDSVTVSVDAVVYYKISNPMSSVCTSQMQTILLVCWHLQLSETFLEPSPYKSFYQIGITLAIRYLNNWILLQTHGVSMLNVLK